MESDSGHTDDIKRLMAALQQFAQERDWDPFHTPKNLSMALAVEASELMEIFQWMDGQAPYSDFSESKRLAVEHEVADVLLYLLRFCAITGIDPIKAADAKLILNAQKYPADLVRGRSDKYTEY